MSLFSDVAERIRGLLFRARDEREMQEELQFHVTMESEQHQRAGMASGEARRQSLMALGGLERTKEEIRDAGGAREVTDLGGDLRYAVRTLRQRPAFAIVAIATIAIGIGATAAVFSSLDAVILKALPYRDPGQLVRLYKSDSTDRNERSVVTPVHFLAYRDRLASMQSIAALNLYDVSGADIGSGDDVQRIRTMVVSSDYFDVLQSRPALGRPFGRDAENGINDDGAPGLPVVVISNRLWRSRFHSDPQIVGGSMEMDGRSSTILGVMPARFADPIVGPDVDAWVPLDVTPGKDPSNANNHYLSVIGRLAPGVTIARAQAELDGLSRELQKSYSGRAPMTAAQLYPLKDDLVGPARSSLELIGGAVGLMLLLVCVNIANLLLVRGSERAREFAMRSALGARRSRLVRQLLTESLVLAFSGVLLALPLAWLLMRGIVLLGGRSIPRLDSLTLDWRVVGFSVLAAVGSAILFGLVPAWRAAQTQPADVLRREGRSATGDRAQGRLRSALVTAQIALAFMLMVGAGLLLASFRALETTPLGIEADHALTFQVHLPTVRYDSTARLLFHQRFDRALTSIPGVVAAGATSHLPVDGPYNDWGVEVLSGPLVGTDKARNGGQQRIVTPGFLKAAGIRLLDGRWFTDADDAAAPHRVVISKSAAALYFPGVSAIGQRLNRSDDFIAEVIGVVEDAALDAEGDVSRTVYRPHAQFAGNRNWSLYQVVRTSGDPAAALSQVRRALTAIDPQLVMDQTRTFDAVIGGGTAQRAFALDLLLAFALTALFLAALGVFGVLSYTVRLRSAEFGLRIALGATPAIIRGSVLRAAAVVTSAGILLGAIGAIAFSRVMSSLVFHVSTVDPVVLIGAALFMAVVGGGAAYLPARRATAMDPRTVLQ